MKRLAVILLALLMLVLAATACGGLPPCPENYSASTTVEFCVRY